MPDRPRGKGPVLLQLCVYLIAGLVLLLYAIVYPAGLPLWRYFGTVAAMIGFLALNLAWFRGLTGAVPGARPFLEWSFFASSTVMVLLAVGFSGQPPLVYLVSAVCGQVAFRRGAWPAAVSFGVTVLLACLGLQAALGQSLWQIVGTAMGLVTGILFVLVLTTVLRRSELQGQRMKALVEELQAAHADLAAAHAKEVEAAIAQERMRLARDLHDSVTQLLYGLTLYSQAAVENLSEGHVEPAIGQVRTIRDTAQEALREMRLLVFELHSPALAVGGLEGALRARLEAVEKRGGIRAELSREGVEMLSRDDQAELYSIAREALNNSLKHAHATAVRVSLRFAADGAELEVADDGAGFVAGEGHEGGLGLAGMRGRAGKIGATLCIESTPGKGTKVRAALPPGPRPRQEQAQ